MCPFNFNILFLMLYFDIHSKLTYFKYKILELNLKSNQKKDKENKKIFAYMVGACVQTLPICMLEGATSAQKVHENAKKKNEFEKGERGCAYAFWFSVSFYVSPDILKGEVMRLGVSMGRDISPETLGVSSMDLQDIYLIDVKLDNFITKKINKSKTFNICTSKFKQITDNTKKNVVLLFENGNNTKNYNSGDNFENKISIHLHIY